MEEKNKKYSSIGRRITLSTFKVSYDGQEGLILYLLTKYKSNANQMYLNLSNGLY